MNPFARFRGFSMGANDIVLTTRSEEDLKRIAGAARAKVSETLSSVHDGSFENPTAESDERHLENRIRAILLKADDEVLKTVRRDGQERKSRLFSMVDAGSKGNDSNIRQMMGMLGQNYVDHERIMHSADGRTLPHFKRFDDGADARGS